MITRFAPSPTGPLHLGHAFSALTAFELAQKNKGQFLLRIEDIDGSRSRPHWEAQIFDDLEWLGFSWQQPVMRQSDHLDRYHHALDQLWDDGLLYPCTCNRKDILAATSAPHGPIIGPDGLVYPGTCRNKSRPKERPRDLALRLDIAMACSEVSQLEFTETLYQTSSPHCVLVNAHDLIEAVGDVVLSRRDMGTSYHLSVVLDDQAQGISDVVRGEDLFDATAIHVLLQHLMGLSSPNYHHHRLVTDETGKRLAKRDDAKAISLFRREGCTPDDVRRMVGLG